MKKIFKEFKEFAIKGNMFDMAIGIIIGSAFSKVVNSIVGDIFMPPLGYMLGKVDLKELKWILHKAEINSSGEIINNAVVFSYGNFIQICIDFLVVAISVFLIIKLFNNLRRKAEDPQVEEVPTPANIVLLSEIRDLLKQNNTK